MFNMTYRVDFNDGSRKQYELSSNDFQMILDMKYELDRSLENVAYTEELWEE